jgi:hypothetical protein
VRIEALFAWHYRDGTHLLRVPWGGGPAEFATQFTAIGGPRGRALFALSRASYMEYATVPLEGAKMLALNAADDVIRAESAGVGLPVQMAVAGPAGAALLSAGDVRALEDTVAAFREYQRDYLVRQEDAAPKRDTGVRPP